MIIQRRQFLRLLGAAPAATPIMGVPLLAALAGCSSPNPNYYRLGATSGPAVPDGPPTVEVRSVSIPGYLDRQGIVKRAGDFKLDIHTNDIWAEPLADMLQATLVQDLAQADARHDCDRLRRLDRRQCESDHRDQRHAL